MDRLLALTVLLGFTVCSGVDACYDNYESCYSAFSKVSTPTSALADWSGYCKAVEMYDKCLKEDSSDCADDASVPVAYKLRVSQTKELKQQCEMYCPGLNDCFTHSNTHIGICRNIDKLINCVKSKCTGKPEVGSQTLTEIREVFNRICRNLNKYTAIYSCNGFQTCIGKSPSLPGTGTDFESLLLVRDTDNWCRIARSYMNCAVIVPQDSQCRLPNSYETDTKQIQQYTGATCSAVKTPCLPVFNCIKTLQGTQTRLSFKDTCPNIPAFTRCAESALNTCGDESRDDADYSLTDVQKLYTKTCDTLTPKFYSCDLMNQCFRHVQLPEYPGDKMVELTNQTLWCHNLNKLVKCAAEVTTTCGESENAREKLKELNEEIMDVCGLKDDNSASGIAVNGLLVAMVLAVLFMVH